MEKTAENKLMVGTVLFLILLFFIGGIMTRNMDTSTTVDGKSIVNM